MTDEPLDAVDVSEFEEARAHKGSLCSIGTTPFTAEQRTKLDFVLDHRPDIPHTAIAKVLKGWSYTIAASTVGRHRKRQCTCPPADRA